MYLGQSLQGHLRHEPVRRGILFPLHSDVHISSIWKFPFNKSKSCEYLNIQKTKKPTNLYVEGAACSLGFSGHPFLHPLGPV